MSGHTLILVGSGRLARPSPHATVESTHEATPHPGGRRRTRGGVTRTRLNGTFRAARGGRVHAGADPAGVAGYWIPGQRARGQSCPAANKAPRRRPAGRVQPVLLRGGRTRPG